MLKTIPKYSKDLVTALSSKRTRLAILFLFFGFTATIIRLPFILSTNLDEGTYLAVSSFVSQGHMLYKEVLESKPPLFYFINAVLSVVVGNNVFAFRGFVIVLSAMTAILIYKILEHELARPSFAILGGLAFAAFSSVPIYEVFWVMTESYLLFFETLVISFIILRPIGKYSYLIAGFLGGCSFLVRQTALLFNFVVFGVILYKMIKDKSASSRKDIALYSLGAITPLSVAVSYFLFNNALQDFVYWTIREPLGFIELVNKTGGLPISLKGQWLGDILTVSLPLVFLTMASVGLFFGEHKISNRHMYFGLLSLFPLVLLSIFVLGILPGFHHEYAEFLIPLSIGSGYGSFYLWSYSRKSRQIRMICVILMVVLLGVTITSMKPTILRYEYQTEGLKTIENIRQLLDREYSEGKTLYAFETIWPKDSLYIYFVSNKYPPIDRFFYFPPYISRSETLLLLEGLEREPTQSIVLIGPRPSFEEARNIYDYIITHYHDVAVLGPYSPYPWLPAQNISILTRINASRFERTTSVTVENWKLATPDNVSVEASIIDSNQTIMGEYDLFGDQKWFSLLFGLNETIDAEAGDVHLNIKLADMTANITLQIDAIDEEGNYSRFEITNMFPDEDLYIPLRKNLFLNQTRYYPDFKAIKGIHVSIAVLSGNSVSKGAFSISVPTFVTEKP